MMQTFNLSKVVSRTKSNEKYMNPVHVTITKVAQNNKYPRQQSPGTPKKEIIVMNVYSRKSVHSPCKCDDIEESKIARSLKKDSIFDSGLSGIESNQEYMLGSGLGLSGFLDGNLESSPVLKISPCFPSEKSSPKSAKLPKKTNKSIRDSQIHESDKEVVIDIYKNRMKTGQESPMNLPTSHSIVLTESAKKLSQSDAHLTTERNSSRPFISKKLSELNHACFPEKPRLSEHQSHKKSHSMATSPSLTAKIVVDLAYLRKKNNKKDRSDKNIVDTSLTKKFSVPNLTPAKSKGTTKELEHQHARHELRKSTEISSTLNSDQKRKYSSRKRGVEITINKVTPNEKSSKNNKSTSWFFDRDGVKPQKIIDNLEIEFNEQETVASTSNKKEKQTLKKSMNSSSVNEKKSLFYNFLTMNTVL